MSERLAAISAVMETLEQMRALTLQGTGDKWLREIGLADQVNELHRLLYEVEG